MADASVVAALMEGSALGARQSASLVRALLCSTTPAWQGPSGYHRIAEYIPNSACISLPKARDGALWGLATRVARRFATTRSYQTGAFALEYRVWHRLLQERRFNLLHLLWANHDFGFLDRVISRRVKLVATIHSCPDEIASTFRFPGRLAAVDAFILMSECQRQSLLDLGIPESKLHVVLHGIDTDFYHPLPRRVACDRAHPGTFTVLHVGTHRRDLRLLRKVTEILSCYEQIHFEVISAPDTHSLFAGCANVSCHCGLSPEDFRSRYQSASCLLQLVTAATANNALLEGMASGLPVVSQVVGGVPEYAFSSDAILCAPGDAEGIADAVLKVYASPMLQVEMGEASRRRANELQWRNVAAATSEVYEGLFR